MELTKQEEEYLNIYMNGIEDMCKCLDEDCSYFNFLEGKGSNIYIDDYLNKKVLCSSYFEFKIVLDENFTFDFLLKNIREQIVFFVLQKYKKRKEKKYENKL